MRAIVLSSFLLACAISSPIVAMDKEGDKKPAASGNLFDMIDDMDDSSTGSSVADSIICDYVPDVPDVFKPPEEAYPPLPLFEGIRLSPGTGITAYLEIEKVLADFAQEIEKLFPLEKQHMKFIDQISDSEVKRYVKLALLKKFSYGHIAHFSTNDLRKFESAKRIIESFLANPKSTTVKNYTLALQQIKNVIREFKRNYKNRSNCLQIISKAIKEWPEVKGLTPAGVELIEKMTANNQAVKNFFIVRLSAQNSKLLSSIPIAGKEENSKLLEAIIGEFEANSSLSTINKKIFTSVRKTLEKSRKIYLNAKESVYGQNSAKSPTVASRPPADQQSSSDEEKKPAAKKQKKPAQDSRKPAAK